MTPDDTEAMAALEKFIMDTEGRLDGFYERITYSKEVWERVDTRGVVRWIEAVRERLYHGH